MTRRRKVLGVVLILLVLAVSSLALTLSHDSPCGAAPALPAGVEQMKAIVYRCYGSTDVVRLENVAKPTLQDDRVLVRVRAASVNPLDLHFMQGKPYVMRTGVGLGAPDDIRLGTDYAGTVEAVGKNVKRFKPGDEVFGGTTGAFAQYVRVREYGSLALKPTNVTFEQAAAIPVAAVTALQALRDQGNIQPGQNVLINGASGGVGTFAVQIAKALGANVTAVCSTRNVAVVRSIGADRVIDYTQEDFTRGSQRYDLIIDNVGSHSLSEYRHVMNPKGTLVIVGGPSDDPWLGPLWGMVKAVVVSPFASQKLVFLMSSLNKEDMETLRNLTQSGQLVPVIDKRYTLGETAKAIRYLQQGHARGKVVIALE